MMSNAIRVAMKNAVWPLNANFTSYTFTNPSTPETSKMENGDENRNTEKINKGVV